MDQLRLRRSLVAVTVAAVLSGAAAGCGDDEALSADDFRSQTRKICLDSRRELGKAEEGVGVGDREYARKLERLVAINGRTRERLADLEPPEDLTTAHQDLLKANEDGADLIQEIADRLKRGETRKEIFVRELGGRIRAVAKRTSAAARRLGVKECGSGL